MKLIRLFVFFLTIAANAKGQQYLRIEGEELAHPAATIDRQKSIRIFTVGGMINFRPGADLMRTTHRIHSYFKESNYNHQPSLSKNEGKIYLQPNQELLIDVLHKQTDSLICRYIIKRLKLTPKLHIIAENGSVQKWTFSNVNSLKLSPGEKIQVEAFKDKRINNLEIEYTLIDLETETKTYKKFNSANFEEIKLKPNNNFELRINYVIQKESIGIVYINVRPHWYQSAAIYFIIFMIILATVYLLTTLRLRKKIQSSEEEQQKMEQAAIRLQSLLNPHFTFNALSSIQGLMNTDRILEANQYLEAFGSLLRQTLARSNHIYTSLDVELEMMRMYINIEAFRFNFSWTIEVVGEFNPSVIEIPTLLLQPLIENSIKHGIMALGEKGKLCIICREGSKTGTLIIEIKDNGKWLDTKNGHGLKLTEERIMVINRMRKEKAIELNFNKLGGTEVSLTFHNWIN